MLFTPSTSSSGASATEGNSSISTYATTTPTVGISLPTSISFNDVLPTTTGATTTASTNLTVTTNDSAGYSLYLYTDEDNSLKPVNPANNSSISATSTPGTLSDLVNNTWGYSIGTTTAGPDVLYAAVPTDNSTPIQTKDTSTTNSANDTYTLTFGAKVDTDLPSGTYSNTLTLAVVAEPKAITSIQDLTLTECQAKASDSNLTVIDSRDNNDYTVRYINGACWMTQNLRLSGGRNLTPADSNVTSNWEFPNNSIKSGEANYIGDSYTEAGSTISDDVSYGGYYNYCAASAGTVCNYTTAQDATQDICPKGWRLPTHDEQDGITNYTSAFSPVYSGFYYNGSLSDTGSYGYWWSATADYSDFQYYLGYSSGSLNTSSNVGRNFGFSVRCINPGSLTINFNGNGATSGNMTSQRIPVGNTASLNSNSFTRTGYMFTGWNTKANGSGTSYTDGADYTVTTTGDTTITLYAQWKQIISMQDFTLSDCQSQASNSNITVTDLRDGNDYTVRYINGACWMTQNLRLPGGTKLTPADSNVTQDYTLPSSSTSGFNSYTVANMYNGTDTTYGAYYNFCAASAGTVCSTSSAPDATQDICPKGWRLPTYSEVWPITATTHVSAFSPVLSGNYYNGSLRNVGTYGNWWSATAYNNASQYYLRYAGSSLDTDANTKYFGYSVRCIRSS